MTVCKVEPVVRGQAPLDPVSRLPISSLSSERYRICRPPVKTSPTMRAAGESPAGDCGAAATKSWQGKTSIKIEGIRAVFLIKMSLTLVRWGDILHWIVVFAKRSL
jgi:hypothetical protein